MTKYTEMLHYLILSQFIYYQSTAFIFQKPFVHIKSRITIMNDNNKVGDRFTNEFSENEIINRIIQGSTHKEFMQSIKQLAQIDRPKLSNIEMNSILNEILNRIDDLNKITLFDIIYFISNTQKSKINDPIVINTFNKIIYKLIANGKNKQIQTSNLLQLLQYFVKIKYLFQELPLQSRELILDVIKQNIQISTSPIFITDTLWCLSKLKFKFKYFNKINQKIIFDYLESVTDIEVNCLSKLCYSLSLLDIKWIELNKIIQGNIQNSICIYAEGMNEQETVNLVYALGKVNNIIYYSIVHYTLI